MRRSTCLIAIVVICLGCWAAAQTSGQQQPSKAAQKVRVSEKHLKSLKKVAPVVSSDVRHAKGSVILAVTIDPDGSISEIKLITGNPVLAAAAIDAVKQWKYKPYMIKGEPVFVETELKVDFSGH